MVGNGKSPSRHRSAGGWPRSRCPSQTTMRVPPVPRTWGPGRLRAPKWQQQSRGLAGSILIDAQAHPNPPGGKVTPLRNRTHPASKGKNPPPHQKELHKINPFWRTIKLEIKHYKKGRRLENVPTIYILKRQVAVPTPSPPIPPYRIPANLELKNKHRFWAVIL